MIEFMDRRIVILVMGWMILSLNVSAQDWNLGIRAGISQSKFNGPLIETEQYGLSGGFHFGVNFQWNFNELIAVRSEIIYTQNGSSYNIRDENGFYVFNRQTNPRYILRDSIDMNLKHSNAYIQFPQTFHVRIGQKLELFGGGYIGLMLSPTATGTIIFGGQRSEQDHAFRQGLNFNYNSDLAGQQNTNFSSSTIEIIVDGVDINLPGLVGAYYLYETKDANRFYNIDYGLIGGVSYYLNRGLYLMGRVEYGLRDITNRAADVSYTDINPNGTLIFDDHNDRNLSFNLSLGFRF